MSTPKINESLPFEVLGHIFSHYADEETIHYPLETLLLVCKAWSLVALGHRRLWNHPRIYLAHDPTSAIWNARLPLRLARCGPDIPLDIDLRNLLGALVLGEAGLEVEMKHFVPKFPCKGSWATRDDFFQDECACDMDVMTCMERSLRTLMGDKGEICARWRSFTLYSGERRYADVSNALSCATPLLEHLELGRVLINEERATTHLFPDVRKLKHLSLFRCHFPSLPNCDNLLDATVELEGPLGTYPDFSALRRASQLQALSLRSTFHAKFPLPAQLHHLRVLKINGEAGIHNTGPHACQMPLLSHLSLDYQDSNLLHGVLLCGGLPVERLTRVTLKWAMRIFLEDYQLTAMMESLRVFMTRARDLKHLEVDGRFVSFVIKVLWNSRCHQTNHLIRSSDSAGPLFNTGYLTKAHGQTIEFDGTQTPVFLEELAKRWVCLGPDLSDDKFIRQIASRFVPF